MPKIVEQSVELLQITENAEQLIERAGRVCYKSEDMISDDSAAKFVSMIKKRGHLSVIEHASATFRIVCPRHVTHELVRHRLASYSQESTRYVSYDDGIQVIMPPEVDDKSKEAWWSAVCQSEESYGKMLKAGCSPQIARSVLPLCLKTEIVMTANLREWLHVFELRTSKAAHPEIRFVANKMRDILREKYPTVFE